jgi:asparagine synthase (glutamine-hydrolysing)
MCAIAGQFSINQKKGFEPFTFREVEKKIFSHRGPDDYGLWTGSNIMLQHWRLAVQDLTSAGHQPMVSSCGQYVICFNGEIYNHLEVRNRIDRIDSDNIGQTVSWKSKSDTETILEGFRCFQEDLFRMLNGMFAIAIYSIKSGRLVLSRDRHGVKPLFFHKSAKAVLFASEAKYFKYCDGFHVKESIYGIHQYLVAGQNYFDSRTLDGIYQLEPGTFMAIESDGKSVNRRYVDRPKFIPIDREESFAIASVSKVLHRAVERQIVSDIPVGIFLSGGVDSSIIAYHTSKILGPHNTNCFSLYYAKYGNEFNECARIAEVVKKLGVNHQFVEFDESKLVEYLERFAWYFDEPFGDPAGLNMMVLSNFVRNHVGVALAGEGADELFGGYRRYRTIKLFNALRKIPLLPVFKIIKHFDNRFCFLSRRQRILLNVGLADNEADQYHEFFKDGDKNDFIKGIGYKDVDRVRSKLKSAFSVHAELSPLARMCLVDQENNLPNVYLEKSDKGSMTRSLEVRVPFLDNDVVEFANSLEDRYRVRGFQGKWILKKAYENYLPKSVLYGTKRGFSVPTAAWFRGPLYEYFHDKVLVSTACSSGCLDQNVLRKYLDDHKTGRVDYSQILWRCMTLELWWRGVDKRECGNIVLQG